jgi:peptidyl-prolyl cis-trans isomerase C
MSCSVKTLLAQSARKTVSVNGTVIGHDDISREAQNHPAPTPIAAWTAAARALVVRELLLQEARRRNVEARPASDGEGRRETEEEALVRGLVEESVAIPTPDEATCRRYYESNRGRFKSATICEASHLLIAARRDQPAGYAAARKRAEQLLARIADDPAQFIRLAAAHSDCPSGASGGNLGQLTPGDTTPEFEAALATLQPGEVTGSLVETRYGFHIIRLNRRIEGRELPFEQVKERIAAYLSDRARRTAIAQFLARLAARAEVKGVDLPTPAELRVS